MQTLEVRSNDAGGLKWYCLPLYREKLCVQNSTKVEAWGHQKGHLSILRIRRGQEMTLVCYLVNHFKLWAVEILSAQPTWNLWEICCCSWKSVSLWGSMGFILCYSKSCQMSLWVLKCPSLNYFSAAFAIWRVDWKLTNIAIFEQGKKEDIVCCRSVSLILMPGEIREIILGFSEKHLKDGAVFAASMGLLQPVGSCLTNIINFYDNVT